MAKIPQLYPMIDNCLVRNHGTDEKGGWLREWCRAVGREPRREVSVEFRPLPEHPCENCKRGLQAFCKEHGL